MKLDLKQNINIKKLLNSKWTALKPKNKEKHFLVTKVIKDDSDSLKTTRVVLESVMTKRKYNLTLTELSDPKTWQSDW